MASTVDLHLRSYGELTAPDRHDYGQLVLPLHGALLLEIEGRQGMLDPLRAGFVAPPTVPSSSTSPPAACRRTPPGACSNARSRRSVPPRAS
jgi:hypothetical protein